MEAWKSDEEMMWAALEADSSPENFRLASDWAEEQVMEDLAYALLWCAVNKVKPWKDTDWHLNLCRHECYYIYYVTEYITIYEFKTFRCAILWLSDRLKTVRCRVPHTLDLLRSLTQEAP